MAEPLTLRAAKPPTNGAAPPAVIDTTTQTFAKDVIESSKAQPVLVDFWAPWCGPCRTLGPIIEKVVGATKGKVRLVKMNTDDHPEIPGQLGIQSIPAVIAFVKGRAVDGFVGALPESQVKAFVDRVLAAAAKGGMADEAADDINAILDEGDRLLAGGDVRNATRFFGEVVNAEPENLRALTGLARAFTAARDFERAKQALAQVPPAKAGDPLVTAARAQLTLAEQTAGLGDPKALRARIAADPADWQARFDLALIQNGAGDREAAADLLLDIVRRNRAWEEEKARKQLVQFFEAWGPKDPATLAGRRRLSSLLFA
jgi:putative thioredoxin